jgi:hypothetical protein
MAFSRRAEVRMPGSGNDGGTGASWLRRTAGYHTKHHDGFALFDSKETDFDVMSTPFGRDIMRALSEAAAEEGIRICWYYSIMDWHVFDWPRDGSLVVDGILSEPNTKVTPRAAERATALVPGLWFDYVEGDFKRLPDFDGAGPARTGTVTAFDLTPPSREMLRHGEVPESWPFT